MPLEKCHACLPDSKDLYHPIKSILIPCAFSTNDQFPNTKSTQKLAMEKKPIMFSNRIQKENSKNLKGLYEKGSNHTDKHDTIEYEQCAATTETT